MADEIEISYESLSRAATDQLDAGDRTRAVNDLRVAATLPPGSLGKLPQSDDIQAAFDQQWNGAGTALDDLERAFAGIADRLTQIRDTHREHDDQVATAFDQMRGGE